MQEDLDITLPEGPSIYSRALAQTVAGEPPGKAPPVPFKAAAKAGVGKAPPLKAPPSHIAKALPAGLQGRPWYGWRHLLPYTFEHIPISGPCFVCGRLFNREQLTTFRFRGDEQAGRRFVCHTCHIGLAHVVDFAMSLAPTSCSTSSSLAGRLSLSIRLTPSSMLQILEQST